MSASDIPQLVASLRRVQPDHGPALAVIHHETPCPPCCDRCHLRHLGNACPCPICHTVHRRDCPTNTRPRPGCLFCQWSDDLARATELADMGDGMRSPTLDSAGGGRSLGTHSEPTESAAGLLGRKRDPGHLARSATHADEAAAWLRTALRVHGRETGDQ